MNEVTRGGKDYIGYDYKNVIVDAEKMSMYIDAYKNFGWLPDDTVAARQQSLGAATLKLKRDRKISNKAELTRLQQHFEACMDEIVMLENAKTRLATIYAIAVGLLGTAFMAGSVFAVTSEPPLLFLCVILGIFGLVGWALPLWIFRFFVQKQSVKAAPLIEQKYDEIHEICEKGNALTHR